jgi:hypothetical protein
MTALVRQLKVDIVAAKLIGGVIPKQEAGIVFLRLKKDQDPVPQPGKFSQNDMIAFGFLPARAVRDIFILPPAPISFGKSALRARKQQKDGFFGLVFHHNHRFCQPYLVVDNPA